MGCLQKHRFTNPLTSRTSKDAALIEQEIRPNSTRLSWKESRILLWKADPPQAGGVFLVRPQAQKWQKALLATPKSSTLRPGLGRLQAAAHTAGMKHTLLPGLTTSLLARQGLGAALLSLAACASNPPQPGSSPQEQREHQAIQYDLTADAWERLGSTEQRDRYRRLAEQTRRAPPEQPSASASWIEALAHALFGPGSWGKK